MRHRRHAFTLVELLVVIGMITVLMALLLPSLRMVREGARRTVCASNLHQQGLAFHAYASDHGDNYPTPVTPFRRSDWPFGAMIVDWSQLPLLPAGQPLLWATGYAKDPHIFYCPSADNNWVIYDNLWNPGNWAQTYVGYCDWAAYRSSQDFSNVLPNLVADKNIQPSDRLLASDLITDATMAGVPTLGPSNHLRFDSASLAGGNELHNDGSVNWVDVSQTTSRFRMTGDGVYYIEFRF